MDKLVLFKKTTRNTLLNKRSGESKFGDHIRMLSSISNIYEQLKNLDVSHVIIGFPEDVGVAANYGNTGTNSAWEVFLKVFLNNQRNEYINPSTILILGHLDFSDELLLLSNLNLSKKKAILRARQLVKEMDTHVSFIISQIVSAGKKPIIIGGGHNNAYGNIKGTALALNQSINVINFDAHSDFRPEEGRHSGNGFSYAFAEGFLDHYFAFGLHENYISDNFIKVTNKTKSIKFNTFEAIEVREELEFNTEIENALQHISENPFGIEMDCDAIQDIPSSAMTPCGFSTNKTRRFLNHFAKHEQARYLHICEAAPTRKTANQVGKLISYLVTDFIKAS